MAMDFNPINLELSFTQRLYQHTAPLLIENVRPGALAFLAAKMFHDTAQPIIMITTPARLDDLFENLSTFLLLSLLSFLHQR